MANNPVLLTPAAAQQVLIGSDGKLTADGIRFLNALLGVAQQASNAVNNVVGALVAANNLDDLNSIPQARQNLGLGSAATHASTDFDAAGSAAAVQATVPTKVSQLANDSNFIPASGAPVQSVNGQTGAVTLSIPAAQVNADWNAASGVAQILNKPALGTAALQNTTAFDPAGAWSSWTGDVAANSHNLNGANLVSTSGLQVSGFLTFETWASMNYSHGAATYMTTNNAGSGAWNEFSYFLNPGAALASDQFSLSVNTRTSASGTDNWISAMLIQMLTGAVTFPQKTTFSIAPVFTDQAGTRTALGLGSVATQSTVPVANGGTGATTASAALANLFTGWTSWTPTLTPATGMTASSVTINSATYIQAGKLVLFKFYVTAVLGGTAGNRVDFSLPVSATGSASICSASVENGSTYTAAVAFINGAGGAGNVSVYLSGQGNFALATTTYFFVEGFYSD